MIPIRGTGADVMSARPARSARAPLERGTGLPATALVACAYLLLALLGTAGLGRALGAPHAAEALHLPGHSRAAAAHGVDAGALRVARPGPPDAKPGETSAAAPGHELGTSLLAAPASPSPDGAAMVVRLLGVLAFGPVAFDADQALPWPGTATPGSILARLHRSVVLHL